MPKYTVIVPARNAATTVYMAVKSVICAFPNDLEVIVWDDGSVDDTAENALRADSKRVKIMSTSHSVGGGVARQRIIEASDSEYLVNQDADDITLPWRHAVQWRLMKDADIVFTAVHKFSAFNYAMKPTLPLSYGPRDVKIALLMHNPLSHPTMFARRSAIEQAGGYSDAYVAQDYDLFMRAAAQGLRIRRSGIPSLAYRMSTTQVSQQPNYASRIASSSVLKKSYSELFAEVKKEHNDVLDEVNSETSASANMHDWNVLINRMRPSLRPFYKRLVLSGRLGYVNSNV